MVLVVSVIFAFCWITECTDYTLLVFFPKLALGNATHVISSTLIMFNSSINPIVYALLSHRFRDEIIRMMRVTHRTRIRKRPEFKNSCKNKASSNQTAEDEPNRNMDNKENCARSRRNPTRSALFANCVAVENVTETWSPTELIVRPSAGWKWDLARCCCLEPCPDQHLMLFLERHL